MMGGPSHPCRQGGWRETSTWDLSVRERETHTHTTPYSVKSLIFWTWWHLLACSQLGMDFGSNWVKKSHSITTCITLLNHSDPVSLYAKC